MKKIILFILMAGMVSAEFAASANYNFTFIFTGGGAIQQATTNYIFDIFTADTFLGQAQSANYNHTLGLYREFLGYTESNTTVDISSYLTDGELVLKYDVATDTIYGLYNFSVENLDWRIGKLNQATNVSINSASEWTPNVSDTFTDNLTASETKLYEINASGTFPHILSPTLNTTILGNDFNKYDMEFTINITVDEAKGYNLIIPIPISSLVNWADATSISNYVDEVSTGVTYTTNSSHVLFNVTTDYGTSESLGSGSYAGKFTYYWQRGQAGGGGGGGGGGQPPVTTTIGAVQPASLDFEIISPDLIHPSQFESALPGTTFRNTVTIRNNEDSDLDFSFTFGCVEGQPFCIDNWTELTTTLTFTNESEGPLPLSVMADGFLSADFRTNIPFTANIERKYSGYMFVIGCLKNTTVCETKQIPMEVTVRDSQLSLSLITGKAVLGRGLSCFDEPREIKLGEHVFGSFQCLRLWVPLSIVLLLGSGWFLLVWWNDKTKQISLFIGAAGLIITGVTLLLVYIL